MSPDRLIDRIAARQHGVFSLAQARQAGLSEAMVRTRLANGAWIRLAPRFMHWPAPQLLGSVN